MQMHYLLAIWALADIEQHLDFLSRDFSYYTTTTTSVVRTSMSARKEELHYSGRNFSSSATPPPPPPGEFFKKCRHSARLSQAFTLNYVSAMT